MTNEMQECIEQIVERINQNDKSLWEGIKLGDQRMHFIEKNEERSREMMDHLKEMIDAQTAMIESLQRDMLQMRDAYYTVFPERLEQDVRVMRQLDALTSKPKP